MCVQLHGCRLPWLLLADLREVAGFVAVPCPRWPQRVPQHAAEEDRALHRLMVPPARTRLRACTPAVCRRAVPSSFREAHGVPLRAPQVPARAQGRLTSGLAPERERVQLKKPCLSRLCEGARHTAGTLEGRHNSVCCGQSRGAVAESHGTL